LKNLMRRESQLRRSMPQRNSDEALRRIMK
jgi:hypothetical protein